MEGTKLDGEVDSQKGSDSEDFLVSVEKIHGKKGLTWVYRLDSGLSSQKHDRSIDDPNFAIT